MSSIVKDSLLESLPIKTSRALGQAVRDFRKTRGLTLENVAGLANVSIKFLSEFERGKETAEVGKVLKVLNALGLELAVGPRRPGMDAAGIRK